MAKVYIGVGSNIDKHLHIPKVLQELQDKFNELEISPIYQTSAIGFEGEDFYNLVVGLTTNLSPVEMYDQLRQLEAEHDRERYSENQFVSRTFDLDQLLYDDLQIDDGKICIPNPDIIDYVFVLKPLVDIAPEVIHPTLQLSMRQIWQQSKFNISELKQIALAEENSFVN